MRRNYELWFSLIGVKRRGKRHGGGGMRIRREDVEGVKLCKSAHRSIRSTKKLEVGPLLKIDNCNSQSSFSFFK